MSTTFDISAFLDTPSHLVEDLGCGVGNSVPLAGADLGDAFDFSHGGLGDASTTASFLPEWAHASTEFDNTSTNHALEQSHGSDVTTSVTQSMQSNESEDVFKPDAYRAKLAAHHSAQLRHFVPPSGVSGRVHANTGSAGQRSHAGSYSSPSVPMSAVARPIGPGSNKSSADLTIQERRRLARRSRTIVEPMPQAQPEPAAVKANKSRAQCTSHVVQQPQIQRAAPSAEAPAPAQSEAPSAEQANVISSEFVERAYSSTGFDLIGALLKVATRPNPKIDIGPVDLSCSFTVSDARHPDQPIVHCSDTFCNLTGYSRSEIVGRNCRFLQSPHGHIEAGSERLDTDNGAVQHIKKNLSRMQECQVSLINYRKDGTPFINLVTIVPITWGDSTEPVFFVGFQVDLIEQPGAIMERKSNGLYTVNYSQSNQMQPSNHVLNNVQEADSALVAFDAAEAEANKRSMLASELAEMIESGDGDNSQWARVLLENSHDIVHVLSLKGTFLYVSPSVERVLGYKPEELVGKSISEFCHPSDVVPVFRELKDSTSNASIAAAARHWARVDGTVNPPTKGGAGQTGPQVNLVMRMKHKHHGHEWIENVGKLHLEQGKGRKVVISTGRQRPMYNLPWEQARRSLNSRAPGFWSKVSANGLILGTSGSASEVIEGGSPTTEHMIPLTGKHFKDLVDANALSAIATALKNLQVSAVPHMMSNGLGGPPQTVISTIIPSSAGGVGLPTVFVYTQRADPQDFASLQRNAVYCQDANVAAQDASNAATLKAGEPSPGSVFGELSTVRSSSWVFELHQLKNANKRLREEVRARQRRIAARRQSIGSNTMSPSKCKKAQPVLAAATVPVAPSMVPTAHSVMAAPPITRSPSSSKFLAFKGRSDTINTTSSSSSSTKNVSMSPSPWLTDNGSGSDSTSRTSVSTQPSSNIAAGAKRSRS